MSLFLQQLYGTRESNSLMLGLLLPSHAIYGLQRAAEYLVGPVECTMLYYIPSLPTQHQVTLLTQSPVSLLTPISSQIGLK